jgi:spore coat protein A
MARLTRVLAVAALTPSRPAAGLSTHGNSIPIQLLARPRVGGTKVWRFVTDFHHPIHLHVEQFQVLSRNGDN